MPTRIPSIPDHLFLKEEDVGNSIERIIVADLPNGDFLAASVSRRDGHPHLSNGYSITGNIWESPGKAPARGIAAHDPSWNRARGGAIGDEIAEYIPALRPFAVAHLADLDGTPIHALANAWYFYADQHLAHELEHYGPDYVLRHGTGRERAARGLGVEVKDLPVDADKATFERFVADQRERWAYEALDCDRLIAVLPEEGLDLGDDLNRKLA